MTISLVMALYITFLTTDIYVRHFADIDRRLYIKNYCQRVSTFYYTDSCLRKEESQFVESKL